MSRSIDVFVAGGGPAGLASAIAARRRGFEVVVADGMRPPIDKACGEGLMPDALAAFGSLGITFPAEHSHPFRGIRFACDGQPPTSVAANFPNGNGLGVRRTTLHALLVEQAERAGVELCWGATVRGLDGDRADTTHGLFRARWIVGADGAGSRVRQWSG